MFTARSTVKDITDHVGPLDPPNDLLNVKKDVLLKYIADLRSTLKGKDEAIEKLSESFQKTIAGIMEKSQTSIVEPLHEDIRTIKESIEHMSSVPKVNLPCVPVPLSKPQAVEMKPYEALTLDFLDETHLASVATSLENMEFKDINKQREVCYMGDYKYAYTGGTHDPAPVPEPIQGLINKVIEKHPGHTVSSCLASKYENGQKFCPAHSDNESTLHPESMIYTFSFGGARPIEFTKRESGGEAVRLELPHNSLLVFSRQSQAYWKHAIPVVDTCEPRYSLTLRLNKPHLMNSTVVYGDSNTKYLKFGEGEGTFGRWMPGKRVKTQRISDLPAIEDIYPYQNIIIHVGINDINRNDRLSTSDYLHKLKNKCNEIHSIYPTTRIILSPLLPTKLHQLNMQIWDINTGIVNLSQTHHNIILMDNSIFAINNNLLNSEYSCYNNPQDCIHLGKTGIRVLAESMKSYVLRKNSHISKSLNYSSAYNHGHRS